MIEGPIIDGHSYTFTARNGTLQEFMAFYQPGDAITWKESAAGSLLMLALGNPHRAQIANFLLDEGAVVENPRFLGYNALHVLIGQLKLSAKEQYDPADDLALMRRLIDAGADINQVDRRSGTPLEYLSSKAYEPYEPYALPFYRIFFERPDLDLLKIGGFKRSTYSLARINTEYTPVFYELCVKYLTDHGIPIPEDEEN